MKFTRYVAPVIILAILLGNTSIASAQGGFKLPNLNPFAKKKKTRTRQTSIKPKKKSSFPSLKLPKWNSTPKRSPYQQATYRKPRSSSNNIFTNLMPWKKKKTAPVRRSATGVRRTYDNSARIPVPQKKKSIFWIPSWFEKKEEPLLPPRTPHDFIAQPRLEIP